MLQALSLMWSHCADGETDLRGRRGSYSKLLAQPEMPCVYTCKVKYFLGKGSEFGQAQSRDHQASKGHLFAVMRTPTDWDHLVWGAHGW